MKLHTHYYNAQTHSWQVESVDAHSEQASHVLSLDKPTVLILPGTGQDDPGKEPDNTIRKIIKMVRPDHIITRTTAPEGRLIIAAKEDALVFPSDPTQKKLNYVLFSWKESSNLITTQDIKHSTENTYPPSEEATLLAKALWKAICTHAKTDSPSKEAIIEALSNLTIFGHSYGALFGERLSLALADQLAQQTNATGRKFSDQDIHDILSSVIQVNIAALSNLATPDKKTFQQYNFCAINDGPALDSITSAIGSEILSDLQRTARGIGYPSSSWLSAIEQGRSKGTMPAKEHLSIRKLPGGIVISDYVPEFLGRAHSATVQTARGPNQRGYADIFERVMMNALTRTKPFENGLEPLLKTAPTLYPTAQDSDAAYDRLITERVQAALGLGKATRGFS